MSSTPFTLRWGIMATGWIAEMFTKDLLTNPIHRSVTDIQHEIVAVGSSSSAEKCTKFLSTINCPYTPKVKVHSSYHSLVADPNVDIIYVATPHSHHFQNAMLALKAGKHVLCEKALTVTASQTKLLMQEAEERGLFIMEAVWTRFFPLSKTVRALAASGTIGTVYRVVADLSFGRDGGDGKTLDFEDSHRMVNVNLAGGALLDIGIYPLTWVMQILYHGQKAGGTKEKPKVVASMNKYHTGADESTTLVLQFEESMTQGIAMSSLRLATDLGEEGATGPAIKIQGSKGEIQVMGPAYRPLEYRVVSAEGKVEKFPCPVPADPEREGWGHGMFWEADECAKCIRDGKKESETMPREESVVIMEVMEEALKQGGVKYPAVITNDVFEEYGKLNTGGR